MKKIALLFASLLAIVGIVPAQASTPPTVVVIDSGFESTQLNNVILEVCVVSIQTGCNNGSGFQEGAGAAGSSFPILSRFRTDWQHGTVMAEIVNQVNPEANLILVRNSKVIRGNVIAGNLADFEKALEWVQSNASRYNIVAVSFSRGSSDYFTKQSNNALVGARIASYERVIATLQARRGSPVLIERYQSMVEDLKLQLSSVAPCPANDSLSKDISALQVAGVATIISAGNNGSRTNINDPACLEPAVAISTRSLYDNADGTANPTLNTNVSAETDFFAAGTFNTRYGRIAESSSAATAAFAAKWAKEYSGGYHGTYSLLVETGVTTKGHSAKSIDVLN